MFDLINACFFGRSAKQGSSRFGSVVKTSIIIKHTELPHGFEGNHIHSSFANTIMAASTRHMDPTTHPPPLTNAYNLNDYLY